MPIPPADAPLLWTGLFPLLCYALALGCVYHASRVGVLEYREVRDLGHSWWGRISAGLTQIFILTLFVGLYWALESWAHFRTPYYVYDQNLDLIPRIQFDELLPSRWRPDHTGVARYVWELLDKHSQHDGIPLSIPLLEASLTYAAMWMAFLLGAGARFAPFLAALVMVNADAILDPVVAQSHACTLTTEGSVAECGSARMGVGLWHWYHPIVDPDSSLATETGRGSSTQLALWFGIPLFNYAAWWAAPLALVSLVLALQYVRGRAWPRWRHIAVRDSMPSGAEATAFGILGTGLLAVFVLLLMSPSTGFRLDPLEQWSTLTLLIVASLVWLGFRIARHDFRSHERADRSLTRPLSYMLLLAVAALLLEGAFLESPALLLVAVVTLIFGSLLTWFPYPPVVRRFFQQLLDLDRFLRIHYLGFAFMLVLLGAFAMRVYVVPDGGQEGLALLLGHSQIGALMGVAFFYHVWGFVLNDVIDLPVDASQPKRSLDPMVRGAIGRASGFALAITAVPGALMLAFSLGVGRDAYLVLLLGMALMAAYNAWGKRCPFPPLTDFVQASAWVCLVVFGAMAVAPGALEAWLAAQSGLLPSDAAARIGAHWILVAAAASWGGGYILLINGVHGGLRDLANDRARQCKTTAIFFGATVDPETGAARSTLGVVLFAYMVHLGMLVVPSWVLFDHAELGLEIGSNRVPVLWLFGTFSGLSLAALWKVVEPRSSNRDQWVTWHIFLLLLPAVTTFIPFFDERARFILLAAFFVPLLALENIIQAALRLLLPRIAREVGDLPS